MPLSEEEQRVLAELDAQFESESGWREAIRQRVEATPRLFRIGGWAAIVAGLAIMLASIAVSVLVSFVGVMLIVVGMLAVAHAAKRPHVLERMWRSVKTYLVSER